MKKWSDIVARAAAFTAVFACVSTSAAAKNNARIGSTSLCGDAYVRALLGDRAPQQIAALSWQSRDPVSLASEAEKKLPQIWDDPEILLAANLDLIVFGPGEGARSASFLENSVQLNWGEDFETVRSNYQLLGEHFGFHSDRVIQNLTQRLSKLGETSFRPRILYLDRSGGSAGPGTFVDAVITAAGGENLITDNGWVKPNAEYILGLKPDLIVTSYFSDGYESVNALPIRHKALQDYLAGHERIEIPGALWPCAGPGLIEAAEILNAKIRSLR